MGTLIQRANGNIIYFDAAESVVKDLPNKVTSHPIEDGSPITDHVVSEPRKVTVTAIISDAAFQFNENDQYTEIITTDDGEAKRVPVPGRSISALNELEQVRDLREVFQLETRNEVFTDMVFTAFSVPRDSMTGDATRIKFTAQQINTVQRRFVNIPAAALDDADKAAENAETGKQSAEDARDKSAAIQGSEFWVGRQLGTTDPDAIAAGVDDLLGSEGI